MTIEEKYNFLEHYCGVTPCSECVLAGAADWLEPCGYEDRPCPCFDTSPESDLDKAIALISNSPENDPVNHPAHYTDGKIEVIDFITDKNLGFCLGNVVKYVSRAGKKDPAKTVEDLKKARFYLDHYIEVLEEASE